MQYGKMLIAKYIILIFLLVLARNSFSDGWELFGDEKKLVNNVILDVGELSLLNQPLGKTWNTKLYKMNDNCIGFDNYKSPSSYGSVPALLLMDKYSSIRLAIINRSISGVKAEVYDVTLYECPTIPDVNESIDELQKKLQQQLRELEARQKELDKLHQK